MEAKILIFPTSRCETTRKPILPRLATGRIFGPLEDHDDWGPEAA